MISIKGSKYKVSINVIFVFVINIKSIYKMKLKKYLVKKNKHLTLDIKAYFKSSMYIKNIL